MDTDSPDAAGPALSQPEHFPMDTDGPDAADAEVQRLGFPVFLLLLLLLLVSARVNVGQRGSGSLSDGCVWFLFVV